MSFYNISVIGDCSVGKTTMANALLNLKFLDQYTPTIGASIIKIPYPHDESKVTWFYFCDTAGMEKYRSLAPVYYRDSNAAVIVYDITDNDSFKHLSDWLGLYRETVGPTHPVLVVGNKLDLEKVRKVTSEEASSWAKSQKCEYLEVSAKDQTNLPLFMDTLYSIIRSSIQSETITKKIQTTESRSCC